MTYLTNLTLPGPTQMSNFAIPGVCIFKFQPTRLPGVKKEQPRPYCCRFNTKPGYVLLISWGGDHHFIDDYCQLTFVLVLNSVDCGCKVLR